MGCRCFRAALPSGAGGGIALGAASPRRLWVFDLSRRIASHPAPRLAVSRVVRVCELVTLRVVALLSGVFHCRVPKLWTFACSKFRTECCPASSVEVIKSKPPAAIAAGGSLQFKTDTVQDSPVSSDVKQKNFAPCILDFHSASNERQGTLIAGSWSPQ